MNIPIKYANYILNGVKQKFLPITTEEAVYDSHGGGTLKNKLKTFEENFGDAFSKEKAYKIGDICIYLNRLYKFTDNKEAGDFDGTKVVPISVSEISGFEEYTNDKGVYRKWNNGYLEQYISAAVTLSIDKAYGNMYQSVVSLQWPTPFKEIYSANVENAQWGTGASWGTMYHRGIDAVSVRVFDEIVRGTSESTYISVYGTGIWK